MSHKPGVLLDLDGTLIDTAPDLAAAANAVRNRRGLDSLPLAQLRNHSSRGARGMLGAALELTPGDSGYESARHEFLTHYRERLTAESRPFPGMCRALTALAGHGLAWGVVTNKLEVYAVPLIEAMAFDPPPACIIGGDTAGIAKPNPAPLLLGCERAGLNPDVSIYVGDSERDIAAGRAAGMYTIGVTYGYFDAAEPIETWGADHLIEHPDALASAVTHMLETARSEAAHA